MPASFLSAFALIASVLFVTELTDKDALLLLTLATRVRASVVFLAGATAFVFTTTIFVTLGALVSSAIPIFWVRLAGGVVMVGFGLWQVVNIMRGKAPKEESVNAGSSGWKAFFGIVAALAILDIAGDATEILTIVFVAQYSSAFLVFSAACTGLIAATAFETALGNQLGRMLTAKRLTYVSTAVFLGLGAYILASLLL